MRKKARLFTDFTVFFMIFCFFISGINAIKIHKVYAETDAAATSTESSEADSTDLDEESVAPEPVVMEVIDDPLFKEPVEILSTLGVFKGYDDGTWGLDRTITRAEFAAMVVRILGLEDTIHTDHGFVVFEDVNDEHWGKGYISVANKVGIIKGYGDGSFSPDAPVTYEQVLKMLVCALGYEDYALQKGGYPMGYIVVATDIGLLKNAQGNIGEPAQRGQVAIMVWNALEVDLCERVDFGQDVRYDIKRGKTLLSESFNAFHEIGIITANDTVSLSDEAGISSLRKGYIEITYRDGSREVIYKNEFDVDKLLGHEVDFYAVREEGEDFAKLLWLTSVRTEMLELKAEEILKDSTLDIIRYEREVKGKTAELKEVRIEKNPKVVLNGKRIVNPTADTIKPASGSVILIDTDRNGQYDTLNIISYNTYVVRSLSAGNYTVFSYYEKPLLELDPNSNQYEVHLTFADGSPATFEDIKARDVLSVLITENRAGKQLKRVILSKTKAKGVVSEIEDDKIWVGNKSYKWIADSYTGSFPTLSEDVELYLNFEGRIAGLQKQTNTSRVTYGYLDKIARTSNIDRRPKMRIYTTNNEWKNVQTADKVLVTYDGRNEQINSEDLMDYIQTLSMEISEEKRDFFRVIGFTVDANDVLTRIYLPCDATPLTDRDHYTLDYASEDAKYNRSTASIDDKYHITGSTKYIFVPKNGDEKKYRNKYTLVDSQTYNLALLEVNEFDNVGIVVIMEKEGTSYSLFVEDKPLVIVDRISKTIVDEEIISRMYGLQEDQSIAYDGAEEVIFTSYRDGQRVDIPDLTLDELKPGDIIQIQPDGDSRIEWVIRFNNSEEELFSDTVYFERNRDLYMIRPATSTSIPGPSNTYFICGRVELMQSNYVKLYLGKDEEGEDIYKSYSLSGNTRVYLNNKTLGKVKQTTLGEMMIGDKVFMRVIGRGAREVVLLRQ